MRRRLSSLLQGLGFALAAGAIAGLVAAEKSEVTAHWAFVAPRRPAAPVTKGTWPANPIDHFILARLEKERIKPSPQADRVTLIRRVTLDLIGLPPTLAEVDAFLNDRGTDAYARLVERLLASPHYGERWGRLWLDVARYADSNGYSVDAPRSIWKYRDWVIEALNRDLPFDQFALEQLAGDLLPQPTIAQRIATGFNRNTQVNQEGGIDPEQFRVESVMDRVNTTATAFLGVTLACAQCHDHKFDPFTQREYYQFYAFFNDTIEDGHGKGAPEGMLEIPGENQPKPVTTLVMVERDSPRDTTVFIKGDFTRPGARVTPALPASLVAGARAALPENGGLKPEGSQRRLTRLDLARWIVSTNNPLTARVTVNRLWQQYFGRGLVGTENDFGTQGSPPSHPELLEWLACELTHPVELDATGVAAPWSLKHLHRLIVNSATYRQSSRTRPDLAVVDPNNQWLARQSRLRLDSEIVRDVGLGASGLLSEKIGGPSVFPPQPEGVMTLGQSRREWKPSTGPDRYRRGIYTFFWRATPHPSLMVFDSADGFSTCTRRVRSSTPLQALTLLNDEAFHEFAQNLAARVLKEGPKTDPARVEYAFRLCLARRPALDEKRRLLALLRKESNAWRQAPAQAAAMLGSAWELTTSPVALAAWTTVARVLLNLDETITRE